MSGENPAHAVIYTDNCGLCHTNITQ